MGGAVLGGYELRGVEERMARKTNSPKHEEPKKEEPKEFNQEVGEELLKKIYEDGKNNQGKNTENLIIEYFDQRFPPGTHPSPQEILEIFQEIARRKEVFADEVLGNKDGEFSNKEKAALKRELHKNPGLKQLVELENRVEKIVEEEAGKEKNDDGEEPEKKQEKEKIDRA